MPAAGRFFVTLTYMLLVSILSLTPDRPEPGDAVFVWLVHTTPSLIQKLLHVCVYAGLTILGAWTLVFLRSWNARFVSAVVIAVGFGPCWSGCSSRSLGVLARSTT